MKNDATFEDFLRMMAGGGGTAQQSDEPSAEQMLDEMEPAMKVLEGTIKRFKQIGYSEESAREMAWTLLKHGMEGS